MEGLLIYVPKITPRVSYTFSLFFDLLMNTTHRLTANADEYKTYSGPKFCYAEKPIDNSLFFYSANLLFETGIKEQPISVFDWNNTKAFYKTNGEALPFDLFAASFYLVSRYEEYIMTARDEHQRFRYEDSLACKYNFIDKPLVNIWALELKKILLQKFPSLQVTESKYKFTPTIDIDVAYQHRGRILGVTIGSVLKALSKFKFAFVIDKKLTLLRLRKDKYDTYDYQEGIFKKYNLRPIYFFLAANRGPFDTNISTSSGAFKKLVSRIDKIADVGIHPSYQSDSKAGIVGMELKRVERNMQGQITKSRQHFLRVFLPETYRTLAKLGVTDDYSLSHAQHAGFRASTCTPFFFYDLPNEETLPVKVHPTIVMDGTLMQYMKLSPVAATLLVEKLIREVKRYNGEFISIWHNQSLDETAEWNGWRKVFEMMIEKAI